MNEYLALIMPTRCIRIVRVLLLALAIVSIAVLVNVGAEADPGVSITDGFDRRALDTRIWTEGQISARQYRFDRLIKREGKRALKITLSGDDNGCMGDNGIKCQRAEIRVIQSRQLKFGQDAWYAFSFRVGDDVA